MILNKLHDQINYKKSFLCIGLDIDKDKIPRSLLKFDDPIFKTIFLALFIYIYYELFFLLFQNFL